MAERTADGVYIATADSTRFDLDIDVCCLLAQSVLGTRARIP
jgi:hypothetical protein